MKLLIVAIVLILSSGIAAVPIAAEVTLQPKQQYRQVVTGYEYKEIGRYWTWHGKARKYGMVPVYSMVAVPEPSTYAMVLIGLGLIAWKVKSKPNES